MRLYELMLRQGRERGDALFYKDETACLTYRDALRQVEERREAMEEMGVKGKVTAFYLHHPLEQLLYFLAAQWAGAVPLLLHEYLEEEDLPRLFQKRRIHLFLSDRDIPGLSLVKKGSLYGKEMGRELAGKGDFAVLTSGSSGLPKVLFRRDGSWSDFFPVQNGIFNVTKESRLFMHGSMAFTGNFNMAMAFLHEGASIHVSSGLSPKNWMKRIEEEHISHVYMIPSKLSPLSKTKGKASGLTHILTGSQLMTVSLYRRLGERFPGAKIILYYGSSELSYVSYAEGKDILQKPDSVGKPFPGVRVSINKGEIMVDTPYGAEGIALPFTCHDLGRMDEEGTLHFLGRKEDMYHIKGNHVAKRKLLSRLLLLEGVEEAEVASWKLDNGDDRLTAFLAGSTLSDEKIVEELLKSLHPWEIPSAFVRAPSIPHTSTGKTDMRRLTSPEYLNEREQQ